MSIFPLRCDKLNRLDNFLQAGLNDAPQQQARTAAMQVAMRSALEVSREIYVIHIIPVLGQTLMTQS